MHILHTHSLCSLIVTVQSCISTEDTADRWIECVDNIWDRKLPHFRDTSVDGGLFLYDPSTGRYGFAEGLDDDIRNEWLLTDLDTLSIQEETKHNSATEAALASLDIRKYSQK